MIGYAVSWHGHTHMAAVLLILFVAAPAVRAQVEKQSRHAVGFKDPDVMFQWIEGKWKFGSRTCGDNYARYAAPEDRKTLELTSVKANPETGQSEAARYTYRVLEVGRYFIRAQIEGEKRLTDDGKPVIWDLIFLSKDEIVWHRTDWPGLSSTAPQFRCE